MSTRYIPYEEPHLEPILILSSFLYLANVARYFVDRYLYAGLLGEIAVGIIYGSPLAGILEHVWEETFLTLGYLGLLLIVFEGGLSTPLDTLFASLPLATAVALTGIGAPILLSLALFSGGFGYPLLESFAAGAALSSTSLGTTFTVLRSAGGDLALEKTRIGTVLAAGAVFDDIIGFVLSTIIRTLGVTSPPSAIAPWSVARPLVTSFLYITLAIPVVRFGFAPIYRRFLHGRLMRHPERPKLALIGVIGGLALGVAITGLIGSSPLLGVYVVGLSLTYLPPAEAAAAEASTHSAALRSQENTPVPSVHDQVHPFHEAFETYLLPLQTWFFSPLFFASIGTAIPFLALWSGRIIWKGVVYAILMLFGKLLCGFWILLWDHFESRRAGKRDTPTKSASAATDAGFFKSGAGAHRLGEPEPDERGYGTMREMSGTAVRPRAPPSSPSLEPTALPLPTTSVSATSPAPRSSAAQRAWVPAAFLGLAMCARGEIGLLIAQIGYTESALLTEEGFLVAIWAILLNTLVGPITVGVLVKQFGSMVKAGRWA